MSALEEILTGFDRKLIRMTQDIILLEEIVNNFESRIISNEMDFIKYCQEHPKTTDQWMEERLRALECQIKELKEKKDAQ